MDYGYIAGVNYESACDGTGVRAAIFLSGCTHFCPGCHNPETHNPYFGTPVTEDLIKTIADEIKARPYLSGITLTGGDPLYCPLHTLNFVVTLKRYLGYLPNIWLYTGYTMDEIDKWNPQLEFVTHAQALIALCDVIVDGKFVKDLADKRLAFRGSSNQKIIYNVPKG